MSSIRLKDTCHKKVVSPTVYGEEEEEGDVVYKVVQYVVYNVI